MLQNKDFDNSKAVKSFLTFSDQPKCLGRFPGSMYLLKATDTLCGFNNLTTWRQ